MCSETPSAPNVTASFTVPVSIFRFGDNDNAVEISKIFTAPGRLHSTYNFDLLEWGGLDVSGIKKAISKAIDGFNGTGNVSFAFSNHDVPRVASRQIKPLGLNENQSDALQLLLLKLEVSLIGSTCVYQGEELGLEDVQDIPIDQLKDPWGIEFAPTFLGRDTCRTPMVWNASETNTNYGFSTADKTWLPISKKHAKKAALDAVKRSKSIYNEFSNFLKWRKNQPAMMIANNMTKPSGGSREIIFERRADKQNLRCIFDFDKLTAEFKEV